VSKSIFYHAGCPVCISAEQDILNLINPSDVEVINFADDKSRLDEAENKNYCNLLEKELLTPDIRLDCPEFEEKPAGNN